VASLICGGEARDEHVAELGWACAKAGRDPQAAAKRSLQAGGAAFNPGRAQRSSPTKLRSLCGGKAENPERGERKMYSSRAGCARRAWNNRAEE